MKLGPEVRSGMRQDILVINDINPSVYLCGVKPGRLADDKLRSHGEMMDCHWLKGGLVNRALFRILNMPFRCY